MHTHSPSWFVLRSKATANISYAALVPTAIFTTFAFLMVVLRWCSRMCARSARIKPEDYLVTAALVCSICITAVVGGEFSIHGRSLTDEGTERSSLPTMLKLVLAQAILYHIAVNLVKTSFILQYLRIFSLIPSMVRSCYILFIFISGAAAWGIFGNIFLCRPVQSYWDISLHGTCMDKENHFWSTSIMGIVLDFVIWALPMPVIGKLKLPRRQRMGILVVFGLGGLVCLITLLRFILVHDAAHHDEVTKAGTYALIFSSIEVNVAVMCASVLVMKPLFARFLPAVVSEQPVSAAEDGRTCRALTGTYLLRGGAGDDEEKSLSGDGVARRDTMIDTSNLLQGIATRKERKKIKGELGTNKRHTF